MYSDLVLLACCGLLADSVNSRRIVSLARSAVPEQHIRKFNTGKVWILGRSSHDAESDLVRNDVLWRRLRFCTQTMSSTTHFLSYYSEYRLVYIRYSHTLTLIVVK
ncbi:hypothetical protein BC832DRAFT_387375 [Gaertneriomyces semiglobifer]|nr:hypothetical protein BC832DRAFT_387375 [Gaertneriomyces semiglobifer]